MLIAVSLAKEFDVLNQHEQKYDALIISERAKIVAVYRVTHPWQEIFLVKSANF